ncbi:MAG TPA: hypothetical protein VF625_09080 [Longimicrobium sp.]|jgi:hypothetical protein
MKRNRRTGNAELSNNLDSFLDTLTNTVGVMVFVLLFVTLAAADATILVRTPLRTDTAKEEIFFEVSGSRVARLDTELGTRRYGNMLDGLPSPNLYNLSSFLRRIYDFRGDAGNHAVRVAGSFLDGDAGLEYRLKENAGDSIRALRDTASEFQRILANADSSKQVVAFLVRPDGLEAFREARKHASRRGFQSGWEPIGADLEGITFVSEGRRVGVQ